MFLKDIFTDIEFCFDNTFLSAFEKSAVIQIVAPLRVINHVFSSYFQDLSLSFVFQS